ncbi:MAG: hypothetical protein AB2669_13605 [Candidatus Thiodiazotropha endolucinida]
MRCIEILVNGKQVCIAGSTNINQLQTTITQGIENITPYIAVNGIRQTDTNIFEYLEWLKQPLSEKDVITIRFVDCKNASQPLVVKQVDKTESYEKHEKKITEAIAKLRESKKKPDLN